MPTGALGNKLQEKMYYNKVKGVLRAIEDSGRCPHAEDPAPSSLTSSTMRST